ncbi:MAG: hypothetical protein LBI30_01020 [Holosporales bacterium]|jgi:hypothetical protein|nr:hypothetical protein [Holosporales bacterium]
MNNRFLKGSLCLAMGAFMLGDFCTNATAALPSTTGLPEDTSPPPTGSYEARKTGMIEAMHNLPAPGERDGEFYRRFLFEPRTEDDRCFQPRMFFPNGPLWKAAGGDPRYAANEEYINFVIEAITETFFKFPLYKELLDDIIVLYHTTFSETRLGFVEWFLPELTPLSYVREGLGAGLKKIAESIPDQHILMFSVDPTECYKVWNTEGVLDSMFGDAKNTLLKSVLTRRNDSRAITEFVPLNPDRLSDHLIAVLAHELTHYRDDLGVYLNGDTNMLGHLEITSPGITARLRRTWSERDGTGRASVCHTYVGGNKCPLVELGLGALLEQWEAGQREEAERLLVFMFSSPTEYVAVSMENAWYAHRNMPLRIGYMVSGDVSQNLVDSIVELAKKMSGNDHYELAESAAVVATKPMSFVLYDSFESDSFTGNKMKFTRDLAHPLNRSQNSFLAYFLMESGVIDQGFRLNSSHALPSSIDATEMENALRELRDLVRRIPDTPSIQFVSGHEEEEHVESMTEPS